MGDTTDPANLSWTDADGEPVELTPKALLERYHTEAIIEDYAGASLFERLLTPKTRALVVEVLADEGDMPLTTKKIANNHPDLSVSGVNRQKDTLLDLGVMIEAGKCGDAQQYRLNTKHPFAQLLQMFISIGGWGRTAPMLGEQFVFEGGPDEFAEAVAVDDVSIPSDAETDR